MMLKSSALALLVATAFSTSAENHSPSTQYLEIGAESVPAFATADSQQRAGYAITLKSQPAINNYYVAIGLDRSSAVELISAEQDTLLAELYAADPSVDLIKRHRAVTNSIFVQMNAETADKFSSHPMVTSINTAENLSTISLQAKESPYASLRVNDAGDSVVVSIIGQGVDYTHKSLGGKGTLQAYLDAYENIGNDWSGFPNDVVIGGFDLFSEVRTYDYNPIEFANDYTDGRGYEYKGGYGTMAASLIRQAAPDAKILSYKAHGLHFGGSVSIGATRANLIAALEFSMDPNLDGDMSDAADIILVNDYFGDGAFYREGELGADGSQVEIQALRQVAASGALVVISASDNSKYYSLVFDENGEKIIEDGKYKTEFKYYHSYFNYSARAITPEALSVGTSLKQADNSYKVDPASAIGPSRGDSVLKPDVLSVLGKTAGAAITSGTGIWEVEGTPFLSAAKVAGTAASIMQANRELAPAEVKALIVNTAKSDIAMPNWGVPQIGGGQVNPLAANSSAVLMYDHDSKQPSLYLGFLATAGHQAVSRNILIKNISDEQQTYTSEIVVNGEKTSNNALTFSFPSTITLAPHSQQIVPVTFKLDASHLDQGLISSGADYAIATWDKMSLQGNIVLTHDVNKAASIEMPWLLLPTMATAMEVDDSVQDFTAHRVIGDNIIPLPFNADIRDHTEYPVRFTSTQTELVNESTVAQQLYAMPLFFQQLRKPQKLANNNGRIISELGGGYYPEAQCESGHKLSLMVRFFEPLDMPRSNHSDRIGSLLYAIKLFSKQGVEDANFNNYILGTILGTTQLTELTVRTKEDGTVSSFFHDLSMPEDRTDRSARITEIDLPLVISPNRKTLISSVCTNDLHHDDINEDTFNDYLGVIVTTDRSTVPSADEDVLLHNFKLGGLMHTTVEAQPEVEACENNFVEDYQGNCIRIFNNDVTDLSMADYFSFAPTELAPTCTRTGFGDTAYTCAISHDRFIGALQFNSPITEPGQIICDIDAGDTLGRCMPEQIKFDQNYAHIGPTDLQLKGILAPVEVLPEGNTLYSGTLIKVAHKNFEDQQDYDWQDSILVEPGARIRVSWINDDACELFADRQRCGVGAALFNPTTDFFAIAEPRGSVPAVAAGQRFSINENAPNGTVIGKLKWKNTTLLNLPVVEMFLSSGELYQPFQVSTDGIISVRDSSQLNHAALASYQLKVHVTMGKISGGSYSFTINVTNDNDNAPVLLSALTDIALTKYQAMSAINISSNFSDIDGDRLVFTSDSLPAGLIISRAGVISGTPSVSGNFAAKIHASDGMNSSVAYVDFIIEAGEQQSADGAANNASSSGGAMVYGLLCLMMVFRRRFH
ncbi:S8 family serine peptidase [Thalassotalea psychrophila]|uniref:S8 family serine peptidase n=1 Tax=Thalassotalea psychrophila TaxID=3065647 RepID=A0ABY9TYC7_9GAMM|nr:S8 family serine peptidase [Colwelliaceae bacterium SQ149]